MSAFDSDEVERAAIAAARLGNDVDTYQSSIADGQGWWIRVHVEGVQVGYVHRHQAEHIEATIKRLKNGACYTCGGALDPARGKVVSHNVMRFDAEQPRSVTVRSHLRCMDAEFQVSHGVMDAVASDVDDTIINALRKEQDT